MPSRARLENSHGRGSHPIRSHAGLVHFRAAGVVIDYPLLVASGTHTNGRVPNFDRITTPDYQPGAKPPLTADAREIEASLTPRISMATRVFPIGYALTSRGG